MISIALNPPTLGDFILASFQNVLTAYSVNLEWDLEWAFDWDLPDDLHSRSDSTWVFRAIVAAVAGEIEGWLDDLVDALYDEDDGGIAAGSRGRPRRPPRSPSVPSSRIRTSRFGTAGKRAAYSSRVSLDDGLGNKQTVTIFTHEDLGPYHIAKPPQGAVYRAVQTNPAVPTARTRDAIKAARNADRGNANVAAGKPRNFSAEDWGNELGYPGKRFVWHHDSRRGRQYLISETLHIEMQKTEFGKHIGIILWHYY